MQPRDDIRDPDVAERLAATWPDAFATRREFLQRTAMAAGIGSAAALLLHPDRVVAAAARAQRRATPIPSPRNMPIDTFVVLMMENRSFDHYLGWLPGADGRQAGLSFVDRSGATRATHRLAADTNGCGFLDPDHSWDGGRTQLAGGRMDGFLKARSDTFSIGYYGEQDLAFTPHVAQAYTAFDRFFCSLLASTYPNREYMHAGQSYGRRDNTRPDAGFPDTTIFAALARAQVSSRYFFTDIPVSVFWGLPGLARSGQVQEYYERAATGTLPAVSFVDPSFNGESQGTSGDEHPHGDVRVGQAFMADVVHAFMDSPQFRSGALFIVYDEWGGFFDHVVPPRVPDLRSSAKLADDFGQMGMRIPAIAVSPYARARHVDHTIYGFESILKMIRYRFGLAPLTPRDLYANNIATAFDWSSEPRLEPAPLPTPAHIMRGACPGSALVTSDGVAFDVEGLLGTPLPLPRPKPHDLATLLHDGTLERFGFRYRTATPATMYRHPSAMGLTP